MQFPSKDAVWSVEELIDPDFFERVKGCEIYELGNGLRVVLLNDPNDRSTYVKMLVNAGSIHQLPENRGIAHFTEHMLFQGTKLFSDQRAFMEHAEEFNLSWNGYTNDGSQGFYVESDNDDESVTEAFVHLSELIWNARIPEEKVEKEKQVVLSERKAGMSDPQDFTNEVINNHIYDQDTPWAGGGVIGSEENINSFNHDSALNFYKKYFHPHNMVLLVVGGREVSFYKRLVDKYFDKEPINDHWDPNPVFDKKRTNANKVTEVEKDFNHVNLFAGYYLHKHTEIKYPSLEFYALRFAANVLSLRIFLDLRDSKGLAYNVGSDFYNYDIGYFFNFAGEFPKERYKEARAAIEDYAQNKLFESVTPVEFKRSLRAFKSIRWAKSGRNVAQHAFNELFFRGQPLSPEATHKYMDQLDVDFVNATVKKFFQGRQMELIAVGPLG